MEKESIPQTGDSIGVRMESVAVGSGDENMVEDSP